MFRPLAIAVTALALAGCGPASTGSTDAFTGEEGDVADLVADLSDAAQKSDEAVVCTELLSKALADKIAGDSEGKCTGEVEKAFGDADGFIIDVDDVTIEGDSATADVSSEQAGDDVSRTFTFVKEDDEWRIDSFG